MATLKQNGIDFTLNADVVAPFAGKYTNVQNFDDNTGLYTQILYDGQVPKRSLTY